MVVPINRHNDLVNLVLEHPANQLPKFVRFIFRDVPYISDLVVVFSHTPPLSGPKKNARPTTTGVALWAPTVAHRADVQLATLSQRRLTHTVSGYLARNATA